MSSHRQSSIQTCSGYTLPGFLIPRQFSDMKYAGMRVCAHHEPDLPFIQDIFDPKTQTNQQKDENKLPSEWNKAHDDHWVSSTKTKGTFSNIIAYNQQC